MGGQKLELAAKMPKMLLRVVFKRPWRPLGGALGSPRWSQVGAKSKLGVSFFLTRKGTRIRSGLGMRFCSFWEPLGEAKTSILYWTGCKNKLFRKLRFNIVLGPVLDGLGRPSWG